MVLSGVCPRRRAWLLLASGVLLASAVSLALVFSTAASARHSFSARAAYGRRWVASWAASPQPAAPGDVFADGFQNQTVRNVIYTSAGGTMARVRVANTYGNRSLQVGRVAIGVGGPGAAVAAGTSLPLTFGGSQSVVIKPGGAAVSDPVRLVTRPLEILAVSIYLPSAKGSPTQHTDAQQVTYVAAGDHVLDSNPGPFTNHASSWYFVTGVDVWGSVRERGTVVALGDSITDGHGSRPNANARWPNDLARRLDAHSGGTLSVIDAGISGNQVLEGTSCCGVSALARFGRDVLHQLGVTDVIVLEGINDIDHTTATAQQIIVGYRELIARAHAAGLRIFGATLTPYEGAFYWTPARERERETINGWIRNSGAFNGVIDFARALEDPRNPQMLRPAYDSGDHLHPNDAGYQAMANTVRLATLLYARRT